MKQIQQQGRNQALEEAYLGCIIKPLVWLSEQVLQRWFTRKCDTADKQETMMSTPAAADQTCILDGGSQGSKSRGSIGHVSQDDEVTRDSRTCLAVGARNDETAGRQSANRNQERRQTLAMLVSGVDDSSLANRRVNIITQRLQ